MLHRSYVCPVATITGSVMMSMEMGQRKLLGAEAADPVGSLPPPAPSAAALPPFPELLSRAVSALLLEGPFVATLAFSDVLFFFVVVVEGLVVVHSIVLVYVFLFLGG